MSAAWSETLARFNAARDDADRIEAEGREHDTAIAARAPDWMVKTLSDGRRCLRWPCLGAFDASAPQERRADYLAWLTSEAAALATSRHYDDRSEAAYNATVAAEAALVRTPAPDLSGAILKLQLFSETQDDHRRGYADPLYLTAALAAPSVDLAWPAAVYVDLCRLSGFAPTMVDFNPADWKARLEAAGGRVKVKRSDGKRELDVTMPPFTPATAKLIGELGAGENRAALLTYLRITPD